MRAEAQTLEKALYIAKRRVWIHVLSIPLAITDRLFWVLAFRHEIKALKVLGRRDDAKLLHEFLRRLRGRLDPIERSSKRFSHAVLLTLRCFKPVPAVRIAQMMKNYAGPGGVG